MIFPLMSYLRCVIFYMSIFCNKAPHLHVFFVIFYTFQMV
nr:MAG TPA: hypothetical protein [Caudoviricetes sp.]DAL26689.1 MAG TPA_asm: hypothetical protein [Caudoviricetes sp.]